MGQILFHALENPFFCTALGVGGVHGDVIRDISGKSGVNSGRSLAPDGLYDIRGAFREHVGTDNGFDAGGFGYRLYNVWFQASAVVPTGPANKPRAWGALACCYLGTPAS